MANLKDALNKLKSFYPREQFSVRHAAEKIGMVPPISVKALIERINRDYVRLTGAFVTFETTDENKDKDTAVFVYVKNIYGKDLAQAVNVASSDKDETEFKDGSRNIIELNINDNIHKAECYDAKITIGCKANGDDTWRFNAQILMEFADGTSLIRRSLYERELKSSNSEVYIDIEGPSLWNIGVRGQILDKQGESMDDVKVEAYDSDSALLDDDYLGSANTDSNGYFEINYPKSKYEDTFDPKERTPDIYLYIWKGSEYIGDTTTRNDIAVPIYDFGPTIPRSPPLHKIQE
jgi:hypothetical protein